MNTSTYKVAISCIGTGVGQSIINSIRTSQLPITTVGFGNNPFAYGAYDCDVMDYLPGIYDANYLNQLIEKCKLHEIDLLIPCLDDEVLLLAQNVDTLKSNGILAIHSDLKIVSICRDKERISYELNNSNLFVRSYNKNSLKNASKKGAIQFPLIAKPKSGYSSNGVKIIRSDDDLHQLTSKDVIQELAIPAKNDPNRIEFDKHLKLGINSQVSEISIQLVFSHESHLLGKMCTNHRLKNGIPIEVVLIDDHRIWGTVNELIPRFQALGVKGPLNLQGRLTDDGLKIFEINPRFTGITGLRALMGFNEVIVCIKNWLGIDSGKYLLEPSHQ